MHLFAGALTRFGWWDQITEPMLPMDNFLMASNKAMRIVIVASVQHRPFRKVSIEKLGQLFSVLPKEGAQIFNCRPWINGLTMNGVIYESA